MLQMQESPLRVSRELFVALAGENPGARLERARDGTLIVMPPTGADGSRRNLQLLFQLELWNRTSAEKGVVFDSNGGFELPNSAIRAADGTWVAWARWDRLTAAERETFSPLCPDFVAELRSPSDRMADLRDKLAEYIDNGAHLGWLIDPYAHSVEIYRPGRDPEVLAAPATLSGEDVLPGFSLDLAPIFAD